MSEQAVIDVFKPMAEQVVAQIQENKPEVPANVVESKLPETKEIEVQKEEALSPKFLAAAKKERELLEKEREYKTRQASLEARLKELEEQDRLAKEDPLKYLEKRGIDYNDLTKQMLEGKVPETHYIRQMRSEVEALKAQLAKDKESAESARKEAAVMNFKKELTQHIHANESKFPLVGALKGEETVYNVIDQHFNETGEILSHEDAATMAEGYFKKQFVEAIQKPAVKELLLKELGLSSETKLNATPNKAAPQNTKPQSVTLTNHLSQDVPVREPRQMSDTERLNHAASMLKWEA